MRNQFWSAGDWMRTDSKVRRLYDITNRILYASLWFKYQVAIYQSINLHFSSTKVKFIGRIISMTSIAIRNCTILWFLKMWLHPIRRTNHNIRFHYRHLSGTVGTSMLYIRTIRVVPTIDCDSSPNADRQQSPFFHYKTPLPAPRGILNRFSNTQTCELDLYGWLLWWFTIRRAGLSRFTDKLRLLPYLRYVQHIGLLVRTRLAGGRRTTAGNVGGEARQSQSHLAHTSSVSNRLEEYRCDIFYLGL